MRSVRAGAGGRLAAASRARERRADVRRSTVPAQSPAPAVVWDVDNLSRIGGHAVEVIGAPRVVATDAGPAVEFDGESRRPARGRQPAGRAVALHPRGRCSRPDADGAEEQRFVHVQEAAHREPGDGRTAAGRRPMEPRHVSAARRRAADAARSRRDPRGGRWHVASLTFDGQTMAHYVDGVPQGAGAVAFTALERRAHVDRRAAESPVVVQGPHPHDSRHACGAGAVGVPAAARRA